MFKHLNLLRVAPDLDPLAEDLVRIFAGAAVFLAAIAPWPIGMILDRYLHEQYLGIAGMFISAVLCFVIRRRWPHGLFRD